MQGKMRGQRRKQTRCQRKEVEWTMAQEPEALEWRRLDAVICTLTKKWHLLKLALDVLSMACNAPSAGFCPFPWHLVAYSWKGKITENSSVMFHSRKGQQLGTWNSYILAWYRSNTTWKSCTQKAALGGGMSAKLIISAVSYKDVSVFHRNPRCLFFSGILCQKAVLRSLVPGTLTKASLSKSGSNPGLPGE